MLTFGYERFQKQIMYRCNYQLLHYLTTIAASYVNTTLLEHV